MACPICQSNDFYVKNPTDEYEIYEFKYLNGKIQYENGTSEAESPKLSKNPEIYCQRCAWHGKVSNAE